MLKERVSQNIRAIRTSLGITQQQLADRTELHVQYISKIENEPLNMTLDMIGKIAKALGVSPAELVAEEPRPSSSKRHLALLDEAMQCLKTFRSQIKVRE